MMLELRVRVVVTGVAVAVVEAHESRAAVEVVAAAFSIRYSGLAYVAGQLPAGQPSRDNAPLSSATNLLRDVITRRTAAGLVDNACASVQRILDVLRSKRPTAGMTWNSTQHASRSS